MEIKFAVRHGHVSDETRQWIAQKLDRLVRLYDRITSIEVIIELERRETPAVELRIRAKQNEFVAAAQAEGLLASVDIVLEKMEQQLRKHKERVQDRHHRSSGREPAEPAPPSLGDS